MAELKIGNKVTKFSSYLDVYYSLLKHIDLIGTGIRKPGEKVTDENPELFNVFHTFSGSWSKPPQVLLDNKRTENCTVINVQGFNNSKKYIIKIELFNQQLAKDIVNEVNNPTLTGFIPSLISHYIDEEKNIPVKYKNSEIKSGKTLIILETK